MFQTTQEKVLSLVHNIANIITIPIVWGLYPESNQRTLGEMDLSPLRRQFSLGLGRRGKAQAAQGGESGYRLRRVSRSWDHGLGNRLDDVGEYEGKISAYGETNYARRYPW